MTGVTTDFRLAMRSLAKKPAFAAIAVTSLALSIGASTAFFSLLDAIILRPLPAIEDPETLASLQADAVSWPSYRDYAERAEGFSGLAAYDSLGLAVEVGGEAPERVFASLVSGSFFSVLGVEPALGAGFAEDDRAEVVVSDRLWRRSLGGARDVVGRQVLVNRRPFTVVGVAPPGFRGVRLHEDPDLWLPLLQLRQIAPPELAFLDPDDRSITWVRVLGRLRPGFSLAQAQASWDAVAAQLAAEFPETDGGSLRPLVRANEAAALGGRSDLLALLKLLVGVTGLILLVACANVATLLLVRAEERKKEIRLRVALGASRRRLVQKLLTESLLVALIGGGLGLVVAAWTLNLMKVFQLPGEIRIETLDLGVDPTAVGFALVLSMATSLIFGLVPAFQASKPRLFDLLSSGSATTSPSGTLVRRSLVALQVALCLVLLIAAGLFVRSLQAALAVDLGFRLDGVLLATVDLSAREFGVEEAEAFYREAGDRLQRLPEVQAFTWATLAPMRGSRMELVDVHGFEARNEEERAVHLNFVDAGYFETLSIPLLRGRGFTASETRGAPFVALVNETMARRFWSGGDPLNDSLRFFGDTSRIEVVGVVADSKHLGPWQEPVPVLYLPFLQHLASVGRDQATLMIRASGGSNEVLTAVGRELQTVAGDVELSGSGPLSRRLDRVLMPQRMGVTLLGFLGLLALVLSAVGVYGVVSFFVTERQHDIGIKRAFGATAGQLLRSTTWQGFSFVLIGLAVGLVAALALVGFIANLLQGVSARDPVAFLGAALLLAAVALVACLIPAFRALRTDPAVTLRYE